VLLLLPLLLLRLLLLFQLLPPLPGLGPESQQRLPALPPGGSRGCLSLRCALPLPLLLSMLLLWLLDPWSLLPLLLWKTSRGC
jgi:hypothetical protein